MEYDAEEDYRSSLEVMDRRYWYCGDDYSAFGKFGCIINFLLNFGFRSEVSGVQAQKSEEGFLEFVFNFKTLYLSESDSRHPFQIAEKDYFPKEWMIRYICAQETMGILTGACKRSEQESYVARMLPILGHTSRIRDEDVQI